MVHTTSVALLRRVPDATDNDAWSLFDATYRDFIMRFLGHRNVDPHVAEDVCQSVLKHVYVEVTSGSFQHNGRKGAFRNWLRQIVASQLSAYRRKSKRHEPSLPVDLDQQLAKDDSKLVRIWDEEHDRATLKLILSLLQDRTSPDSLEIFRRTFVEGECAGQVATQLGRTKNAIVVIKCKVLKQARELAGDLLE